jgi:hypothetical protein
MRGRWRGAKRPRHRRGYPHARAQRTRVGYTNRLAKPFSCFRKLRAASESICIQPELNASQAYLLPYRIRCPLRPAWAATRVGVGVLAVSVPGVVTSCQPRALFRNPFGVDFYAPTGQRITAPGCGLRAATRGLVSIPMSSTPTRVAQNTHQHRPQPTSGVRKPLTT